MEDFTVKKKVDESWKDSVRKEKGGKVEPGPSQAHTPSGFMPEQDFSFFVSTLGMQALAAMGETPDPVSHQIHADLPHAKYLIDTLAMLKEKTHGNLSHEENAMLDNLLYNLQMKFVEKSQA